LLFLAGCSNNAIELGELNEIDCPAAPGSRTPNLAVGLDRNLYLSWIEPLASGHALRFSTWSDGTWSQPRTVASGDNWFVNWADFPSMAATEDGTLAAHWLVRSGSESYAYDVHIAFSNDGGVSWSDPTRPHRDGTKTEHGFVTFVPAAEGKFEVVWLDGRNTAREPPGPMTLRCATVSADGELSSEALIDERVCDCCSTDALRTSDGVTIVAYRDRSPSEIRDISVSRLTESTWSTPRTVHADNWEIGGCPVNGPALARAGDVVAVAWFTAARDVAAVLVAFSRDGGRTFGPPIRVDDGEPLGRVDLVPLDDGSALVSWLERTEDGARVLLRRTRPSGALESTLVASTSESRSSGFPRMVRHKNGVFLAWTAPGEPTRIRTAMLPL
jgi:hypothetical protein